MYVESLSESKQWVEKALRLQTSARIESECCKHDLKLLSDHSTTDGAWIARPIHHETTFSTYLTLYL